MNNLARQVFDLRTQLWQLVDNDQLPAPGGVDRTAVVHQIDYHLHTVEGLIRTLGAPLHLHPTPEGAPDAAQGAPDAPNAPALHPHTPEQPAPGAPSAGTLAKEVQRRAGARTPADRIAAVLESAAAGTAPSRIARDHKIGYDSVTRWITTAEELRNP